MKNRRILTLMLLLIFGSCEKKLEIYPTTDIHEGNALATVGGMDGGLSYAYDMLHESLGRYYTAYSELMADHVVVDKATPDFTFLYARDLNALIERQGSATDLRRPNAVKMREAYNAINAAALVLRGARNDLAQDDPRYADNKNRIMGECHFLRAVAHFELVRFYARSWGATPNNGHPGIVINKDPVVDRVSQVKPRASVAEVYGFIVEDLIKAVELLPEDFDAMVHPAEYYGRASKDAARGYLAKVYFQQQHYAEAKEVIDQIIGPDPGNLSRHQLEEDVTKPFTTRGPEDVSRENIYQTTAPVSGSTLATFWNNDNSLFDWNSATTDGVVSNKFLQDANFYTHDVRDTTLYRVLASGLKTPRKYGMVEHFNIPLIRSAEMVLNRAEIYAMDNNLQAAVKDCNVIRNRAHIPLLSTSITQAALLDSIRTERIRELAFEGDRLHNLRRLQMPIPAGDRPNTAPLPWDGLDLVLKYAPEENSVNPALVNNYE